MYTWGKKKCRFRIHNTSTADEMCQIHVCKIIITKILDNCYHVGILIRNRALVLYSVYVFFDPDKYVYSSTPTSTCILWPDKRVYLWYCSFIVEPIFIVYQLIVSLVRVIYVIVYENNQIIVTKTGMCHWIMLPNSSRISFVITLQSEGLQDVNM